MRYLIVLSLLFSGCTMSFQPFPSVTKGEFAAALKERDDNIMALAQALNRLSPQKDAKK